MTRYDCYVMFDPATGEIKQSGRGSAVARDGLAVAEVIGVDQATISGRTHRVDMTSLIERPFAIPVATLVAIEVP